MDDFPRAFLLVFCQLAVGGMFCLSIAPFHEIARGYYKSSAFVYVAIATLALAGRVALWWPGDSAAPGGGWEIAVWAMFLACAAAYLASLWGERMLLRARAFTAAWASGALALVVLAEGYGSGPALSFETLLLPLSFLLSALLLGAAASGMLLGHWYLIDRDLSLRPLEQTRTLYSRTLLVQLVLLGATVLLLGTAGAPASRSAVAALVTTQAALLGVRVAVSPLGAGALGWMIGKTLEVPQTMAATGLFYIAVLAVIVGELLGRFILFRTGLPL
jgi:hypothetical protein